MKKEFEECPECKKLTVRYESRFCGKRCSNPICNWTETKLTAADVPKSFLRFCLEKAKVVPQKNRIKRILIDTYGSL